MKKLSDNLKRMLAALAYQDAGDYLSMHDKMQVLGYGKDAPGITARPHLKVIKKPVAKRIALISDGRGLGAPLDYAIEACQRQDARIDLLLHGTIDTESISALEKQAQLAGIDCQTIQLGVSAVDDIINYIQQQHSLIFMVAMPDDMVARTLIEEVIPKSARRITVPLVLIEEKASMRLQNQASSPSLPSYGT